MKLTKAQVQLLTEILREQISICGKDIAIHQHQFYVKKLKDLEAIRDYVWQLKQELDNETN